jgi:hypothetical protein
MRPGVCFLFTPSRIKYSFLIERAGQTLIGRTLTLPRRPRNSEGPQHDCADENKRRAHCNHIELHRDIHAPDLHLSCGHEASRRFVQLERKTVAAMRRRFVQSTREQMSLLMTRATTRVFSHSERCLCNKTAFATERHDVRMTTLRPKGNATRA